MRRAAHDPARNVLVTGGAGLVGRALVAELARRGARVHVVDVADPLAPGDASDPAELCRRHADHGPFTDVVALAAAVGVRRVMADPEACRAQNLALGRALVAWLATLAERPRLFAASSSEVYREKRGPLAETDPVRDESARGRWAYAASKLALERAFDAARLEPVHLRFFNVVGPGQDSDQGMVLPRFVEAARAGEPLVVHGDGSHVRTFAHVDDVARTIADLVERRDVPRGPLNVGGTARTSVLGLARAVERAAGRRLAIEHVDPLHELGARFEDVAWREPDLARLASLGVSRPDRSLDDIVRDVWTRHVARRTACASRAS